MAEDLRPPQRHDRPFRSSGPGPCPDCRLGGSRIRGGGRGQGDTGDRHLHCGIRVPGDHADRGAACLADATPAPDREGGVRYGRTPGLERAISRRAAGRRLQQRDPRPGATDSGGLGAEGHGLRAGRPVPVGDARPAGGTRGRSGRLLHRPLRGQQRELPELRHRRRLHESEPLAEPARRGRGHADLRGSHEAPGGPHGPVRAAGLDFPGTAAQSEQLSGDGCLLVRGVGVLRLPGQAAPLGVPVGEGRPERTDHPYGGRGHALGLCQPRGPLREPRQLQQHGDRPRGRPPLRDQPLRRLRDGREREGVDREPDRPRPGGHRGFLGGPDVRLLRIRNLRTLLRVQHDRLPLRPGPRARRPGPPRPGHVRPERRRADTHLHAGGRRDLPGTALPLSVRSDPPEAAGAGQRGDAGLDPLQAELCRTRGRARPRLPVAPEIRAAALPDARLRAGRQRLLRRQRG